MTSSFDRRTWVVLGDLGGLSQGRAPRKSTSIVSIPLGSFRAKVGIVKDDYRLRWASRELYIEYCTRLAKHRVSLYNVYHIVVDCYRQPRS
jgi:hypothetical protein